MNLRQEKRGELDKLKDAIRTRKKAIEDRSTQSDIVDSQNSTICSVLRNILAPLAKKYDINMQCLLTELSIKLRIPITIENAKQREAFIDIPYSPSITSMSEERLQEVYNDFDSKLEFYRKFSRVSGGGTDTLYRTGSGAVNIGINTKTKYFK